MDFGTLGIFVYVDHICVSLHTPVKILECNHAKNVGKFLFFFFFFYGQQ